MTAAGRLTTAATGLFTTAGLVVAGAPALATGDVPALPDGSITVMPEVSETSALDLDDIDAADNAQSAAGSEAPDPVASVADALDGQGEAGLAAGAGAAVPGGATEVSSRQDTTFAPDSDHAWQSDHVGAGQAGTIVDNGDGSLTMVTSANDKIAGKEDGFSFYYTTIDPYAENFEFTASFTVDATEGDKEAAFGLIAVDAIEPGNTAAKYMNSVLVGYAQEKLQVRSVSGYTGAPTSQDGTRNVNSLSMKAGAAAAGETYVFTLRKTDDGYFGSTFVDGVLVEQYELDPDNDLLTRQEDGTLHVGLFAARKVTVTMSDALFTTSPVGEGGTSVAPLGWDQTHVGTGGKGAAIKENLDASVTFMTAENDKIADSEDGFSYYYTSIEAGTENFSLSATFTVDEAAAKDGQSGFGVMAVDTIVPGSSEARYLNSVASGVARYQKPTSSGSTPVNGLPGMRVVRGYSMDPTNPEISDDGGAGPRDMSASTAFDWDWRTDQIEDAKAVRFETGDQFTFTLERNDCGYVAHASFDGKDYEETYWDENDSVLTGHDSDTINVGLFAARKIQVTASDISYTSSVRSTEGVACERPVQYVTPKLASSFTRTTSQKHLDIPVSANVHGSVVLEDAYGTMVGEPVRITPDDIEVRLPVDLVDGRNELRVRLVIDADQPQLAPYEQLASQDDIVRDVSVTVHRYGIPGESLRVSPEGTPEGLGTEASPLDIHTAIAFAQPGQQIVLSGGTYQPQAAVVIARGNDGTPAAPITLMALPGEHVAFDMTDAADGGIVLQADWWHLYGLEVKNTPYTGNKAVTVQGNYNVIERFDVHHNHNTGFQISGDEHADKSTWPSHNLVKSVVSHHNADPYAQDADGFGVKLAVGEGNVLQWCISHHNVDDGFDFVASRVLCRL